MAPNIIPIPEALFDDRDYQAMTPAAKLFLIDLYRQYGDCDRFALEPVRGWWRKLRDLTQAGLIVVDSLFQPDSQRGRQSRVFRFRYSVVTAYE